MTWHDVLNVLPLLCCVPVLIRITRMLQRFGVAMNQRAESERELAKEIKLVVEDLQSRDPQLAEPLAVAALEIDRLIAELEGDMAVGSAVGALNLWRVSKIANRVLRSRRRDR